MTKVAWVRGAYLNNFEGQNYCFEKKSGVELTGFSSLRPIDEKLCFPVIKLPSITDVINNRVSKYICNRLIGDTQILFGLEKYADKFDIFHTADPHYYYSYQLAKLRAQGKIKRLIVTSWETSPHNNESVMKKLEMKKYVIKMADLFLCYTNKAKESLITEGIVESKIRVVRLGVDLGKFRSKKVKVKNLSQKSKVTLLFVGRLVDEKGVMDVIKTVNKIKSLNLNLKVVGNGPLERKLRINNFVTIEKHSYSEMPDVYRSSDILVVPSKTTKTWEEQYGMVLVEAMASGLPIIAYNSGVISEIIGSSGILVEEGNINQLTNQILRLFEYSNNRIDLGLKARRRAEQFFDSRKTAQEIARMYREIVVE